MTKVGDPNAIKDQTFADCNITPYIPALDDTYKETTDLKSFNGDIKQHPILVIFLKSKRYHVGKQRICNTYLHQKTSFHK